MNTDLQLPRKSEQKLAVARHLIDGYFSARAGLKELGILRSERNLQGDYAEWLVAEMLGLQLAESSIKKGIDAHDSEGHTYQVKARIIRNLSQNTSFDFRDLKTQFDYLATVLFDPSLNLLAILKVPYDVVRERASRTSQAFCFRWNRSCAADPRVERLHWKETSPCP